MMRKKATVLLAVAALSTGGVCTNVYGAAVPAVSVEMTNGKNAQINISNLTGDVYAVQLKMQTKETGSNTFSVKPTKADAYSFVHSNTGEVTIYLDAKTPLSKGTTLALGTLQGSDTYQLAASAELIVLDQQLHPTEYKAVSLSVKEEEPGPIDPVKPTGTGGSSSGSAGVTTLEADQKTEENQKKPEEVQEQKAEPADPGSSFTDITGHWAEESIAYLAGKGIIKGIGEGLFMPNKSITRAEFVVILSGMANADLSGYQTSKFSDVPVGIWYQAAVSWANEMGIVNGIGDNKFAPNEPITREQICVMLSAYCEKMGYPLAIGNTNSFTDADQIASYAADSVGKLKEAGVISGKGGGQFAPKDQATRAEVCRMLYTLLEEVLK